MIPFIFRSEQNVHYSTRICFYLPHFISKHTLTNRWKFIRCTVAPAFFCWRFKSIVGTPNFITACCCWGINYSPVTWHFSYQNNTKSIKLILSATLWGWKFSHVTLSSLKVTHIHTHVALSFYSIPPLRYESMWVRLLLVA